MSEEPDRFYINQGDRDLYDSLVEEGYFIEKNRRDQFMLAMAYGFKNDVPKKFDEREQGGFFRTEDLRLEDRTILNAIALHHIDGEIEDLENKKRVFNIAEKYAHGGIRILSDKIESLQYGSFWKHLEKEVKELYQEYDIDE